MLKNSSINSRRSVSKGAGDLKQVGKSKQRDIISNITISK